MNALLRTTLVLVVSSVMTHLLGGSFNIVIASLVAMCLWKLYEIQEALDDKV